LNGQCRWPRFRPRLLFILCGLRFFWLRPITFSLVGSARAGAAITVDRELDMLVAVTGLFAVDAHDDARDVSTTLTPARITIAREHAIEQLFESLLGVHERHPGLRPFADQAHTRDMIALAAEDRLFERGLVERPSSGMASCGAVSLPDRAGVETV